MTIKEILENLCWYDKRNPDYDPETEKSEICYCDNCFYGRDRLANELLNIMSVKKDI